MSLTGDYQNCINVCNKVEILIIFITKTGELKSKQLKMHKFYSVTKTLEIELGGAYEKISGKCKPHENAKSAEEEEATEIF